MLMINNIKQEITIEESLKQRLEFFVIFSPFNKEVMKNNYGIIGYFILTVEFILFNYLFIWNAKRDTAKILKDNK